MNATIASNSGDVTLAGEGGDAGTSGGQSNYGANLSDATVASTSGAIAIDGTGGTEHQVRQRRADPGWLDHWWRR